MKMKPWADADRRTDGRRLGMMLGSEICSFGRDGVKKGQYVGVGFRIAPIGRERRKQLMTRVESSTSRAQYLDFSFWCVMESGSSNRVSVNSNVCSLVLESMLNFDNSAFLNCVAQGTHTCLIHRHLA